MRIVAMSHLLRSVFLGLALAFWGSELQGKDYFITVGGGYTPQQNQASLEANVLFFQKILSENIRSRFDTLFSLRMAATSRLICRFFQRLSPNRNL